MNSGHIQEATPMHTHGQHPGKRRWIGLTLLGLMFAYPGCTFFRSNSPTKQDTPDPRQATAKPGPRQVQYGSDGLVLGEADEPAMTPRQLIEKVELLLKENKSASAERLVHLYPDLSWELLRDPLHENCEVDTLKFIAAAHDRQCTRGAGTLGWQTLVTDRAANPQRYADYDARREQFLRHLQNGRVQQALALNITATPDGVPGDQLEIDAWHLQGLGLLVDDKSCDAAAAFEHAVQLAADTHPFQAVRLMLLSSEAQRRCGDLQQAVSWWQRATGLAASLATQKPPVADPILWERIGYLRPVDTPWSSAIHREIDNLAAQVELEELTGGDVQKVSTASAVRNTTRDETIVWACIGQWRLQRGQPQAALVALKHAEASTQDHQAVAHLQLVQAKALLALDQPVAARGMLIQLTGFPDATISRSATAVLGTMKLQEGGILQGFNLLRHAVEAEPELDWRGRAQAEADLGLACLLLGDEQTGLRWLHKAQQEFERNNDVEQLLQSLENELSYLQQQKRNGDAKNIRTRLASLESA